MALREVCESLGVTQEKLAEIMEGSPREAWVLERSRNPLLALARHDVEALGGELEITVVLKEKRATLEVM